MRSAGIDIAKAGFAAYALAVDALPEYAVTWKADNKLDSEAVRLASFYDFLVIMFKRTKPDIVAVEQVAGFMNRRVVQALSRFEGVALLAAKRHGAIVLHPTVSSSRAAALSVPGGAKKELAWETIKQLYPEFDFGRANQGGMDKGDAMTHALAAPILLERH